MVTIPMTQHSDIQIFVCHHLLLVCNISVTNDTVKVEIWDVVDKGRTQKARASKGILKMFNSPKVGEDGDEDEEGESGQMLDARFLDVYKGAHGVVFTFDITKMWSVVGF